ncbi:Hypothetical predicted protein [Podarcis lilfordi]|uniref:Uncharacterized protein n=1 Tax=Podarcis lilfordi TaxID=74358 RepID=A0AA35PJG1_9SAUR|nr:Hypothetical predicted protein [Podarcis lilfordi]
MGNHFGARYHIVGGCIQVEGGARPNHQSTHNHTRLFPMETEAYLEFLVRPLKFHRSFSLLSFYKCYKNAAQHLISFLIVQKAKTKPSSNSNRIMQQYNFHP